MNDSDRITLLEAKVDAFEKQFSWHDDLHTEELKIEQIGDANFMALYSIVMELAVNAEVPADAFLEHFRIRFRWWHDYYLRRVEDVNPARAAEIDIRSVVESDVDPTYPPLFDPPS